MAHLLRSRWLSCLLLIAGCGTTEVDPPISTLDGRSDLSPDLRRNEVEALDPRLDSDGDGLVDVDELAGWEIRVDATARPQGIETRVVRSDPTMADTDEDGLSDGLERLSGSDPNRADTDGDGLDDVEEVQRWGTSPASVDTDADARGPNPDPSAAPNVDLFDAAELALIPDPADPSSRTSGPEATSPLLADTDGDGVDDYTERMSGTREAHIAEVPAVAISATPGTTLGLFLDLVSTDGTMTTTSTGSTESIGMSGSLATSTGSTTSMAAWYSQMMEIGVVLEIGADLDTLGAKAGVLVNEEFMAGLSVATSLRFGFDTATSNSFGSAASSARGRVASRTDTISGGRVTFAARLTNDGDVPFRLRDLRVESGFYHDADGRTRALTTLRPVSEPSDGFVLARGASTDVILESRDVETGRLLDMMEGGSSFTVLASNYDVLDAGDEHYAFRQARVSERTTAISIEGGPIGPEVRHIATGIRRDAMGRETGLTVAELLDMLGVAHMAEPIADPTTPTQTYIYEIEGQRTELHSGDAPSLADPPYPPDVTPGPRWVRRGWFATFFRRDGSIVFAENLLEASALPGDRVTLVFSEDRDRDGLCAIEESLAGTSDEAIDTDGDGLSDFFEVRVGWTVAVEGEPPFRIRSSPTRADADADGLNDRAELVRFDAATGLHVGTHPRVADTDRDGSSDAVEAASADDALDPLRYDDTDPDGISCVHNQPYARIDGVPVTSTYRATDADVLLEHVVVRFANGEETTFDHDPAHVVTGRVLYEFPVVSAYGIDHNGQRTAVGYCTEGRAL